MRSAVLVVLAACSARIAAPIPPPSAPEFVRVESGDLRGLRGDTALSWRGIPYAAPPIGPLRWRPPQPVAAWTGVRAATGYGYECMQAGDTRNPDDTAVGSEDCLTLNVWRPTNATGALPVMVFVHGGYFTWESSSYRISGVDVYDGAYLASHARAIVVTLNYRLGAFGFLGHAALAAEDPHHSTGNYGLLDQLAALQWVQRNIKAFGGDPAQVTLFGQSAGAISSAALYASPLSRGLFRGVIMHSGNGDALPLAYAERGGELLATRLGCANRAPAATLACMRDESPTAVAEALPASFKQAGLKFQPVVDGYVLPRRPIEVVARGEQQHVPLIVSTTANEFSTMVHNFVDGPIATADDYAPMVTRRFPSFAAKLLELYPAASYPSPLAAYTALWSDAAFICQSDLLANAAAAHQSEPVYRFVFDRALGGALAPFGAGHGYDLLMVFRDLPPAVQLDDADRALSDQLIAAWSQFAHTGALAWPARTPTGAEIEQLDHELHAATARGAHCEFWRGLLYR